MAITVKHHRLANLPPSGNAAVIFVPGGGFVTINPQGLEDSINNPENPHNINVAKNLALDSVHVWSVSYTISNSLDLAKMVTGENCGMATQFSKGDFEFASLKAFWSFRKLLSEIKTDSFPAYGIDTNKVFLVGHSAGAILSIYSTFLGANDMPAQLMSNSSFNPISFTPFSYRMAEDVEEDISNSITNALSEPDNIDGEWVRIVDMGGRVILEGKFPLESDWQQIFIYELDVPSGIYIVQQLRENKIINTKIFKP